MKIKFEKIISKIEKFKVTEKVENFEIDLFFDKIGEDISSLNLKESQKNILIQKLFEFLKNQNPEMEENFSFIHLIENIDTPSYNFYNNELLKFNSETGTITSILLLNRHINSLKVNELNECIELMKTISENENYSENIRNYALDFYKYQTEK